MEGNDPANYTMTENKQSQSWLLTAFIKCQVSKYVVMFKITYKLILLNNSDDLIKCLLPLPKTCFSSIRTGTSTVNDKTAASSRQSIISLTTLGSWKYILKRKSYESKL